MAQIESSLNRFRINTKGNRKIALAAIMLSMALGPFLGTSVNLCIPDMEVYFGVDAATVGWVVTLFVIAMAAFSVPLGKIADLTSRRIMYQIGLAVVTISTICSGLSPNFEFLMACRLFQALGAAMLNATAIPIAIDMFPPEQRGKTIGICTSAVYVGGSIGPAFGGAISSFGSWQWVFWLTAVLPALALILALVGLPKGNYVRRKVKIDKLGNALYLITIVLVLIGFTGLSTRQNAWVVMVAGFVCGALFVLVERKAEEPVVRLSMFTKDRVFTLSNLAALFNYASVAALAYLLSIYFQTVLGWSPLVAGLILLAQPLVQAICAPVAGALSDRMAAWKISTLGMACSCVALAFFAVMPADTPVFVIIIVLMIAGFGFGIFSSPNTSVIMGRVPPREFGSANAIVSTMRTVGQASSMSVVTIVVGIMLGTMTFAQAGPEALLTTIHVCFGVFAVLCVLGILCSVVRSKD